MLRNNGMTLEDQRRKHWFYVDNCIMDDEDKGGYGLSLVAQWVYGKMARHGGMTDECWMSINKAKKKYDIGSDSLNKAIQELILCGLIVRGPRKDATGPFYYYLTEVTKARFGYGSKHPSYKTRGSLVEEKGITSTGEHKNTLLRKNKEELGETAPESDPQGSPPAQGTEGYRAAYEHIYQSGTGPSDPGDTLKGKTGITGSPTVKEDYSFKKVPNLEGAAIFKRMAKESFGTKTKKEVVK